MKIFILLEFPTAAAHAVCDETHLLPLFFYFSSVSIWNTFKDHLLVDYLYWFRLYKLTNKFN